ncbi:MAG: porin [Alphaproteobacteria bacterium]|nr:porin [Alphaproteobacteria bacterium]
MMKKLLLGSTALAVGGLIAAPAMAADPIKIGVGGYYSFFAIAGQVEGVYALNGTSIQYKGLNFYQEGEIHFIGQSKLDNGTTVGVRVELEGWDPSATTANAQIDEAFLFAFGDWGRIEFGALDMAAYKMWYGAPSALINFGFGNPNSGISWMNGAATANNMAAIHLVNGGQIAGQIQDGERINYYTPRFAGFQLGLGYAPKLQVAGTNFPASNALAPGNPNAAVCGYPNPTASTTCPTNDYAWQDEFDVGLNYLNKFGDVAVAAFFGFMMANYVPGTQPFAGGANIITGANLGPWRQLSAGLQLSYAGFTLGGAFLWDNNGMGANYFTGVDNDVRLYEVSLMYETGPWQVSIGGELVFADNGNGVSSVTGITAGTSGLTYGAATTSTAAFGTNPNAGALSFGGETASKIEFGANYALGPGIKVFGGGLITNATGPANSTNGQSWGVLLGMDLRF